jgi:hypothetical protein
MARAAYDFGAGKLHPGIAPSLASTLYPYNYQRSPSVVTAILIVAVQLEIVVTPTKQTTAPALIVTNEAFFSPRERTPAAAAQAFVPVGTPGSVECRCSHFNLQQKHRRDHLFSSWIREPFTSSPVQNSNRRELELFSGCANATLSVPPARI